MSQLQRYQDLPEILGDAIAQKLIQDGAEHRIRESALATLAKHRDQKRRARRKIFTAIALTWICGSFGFWLGGKVPFPNAIAQSESNKLAPQATTPRLLRINLTLSDPKDLKVKQGDFLQEGAIISDRTDERNKLLAQRAEYISTMKRLQLPTTKPIEPLIIKKVPMLPDQSFAEIESNIDLQKIRVKQAQDKVNQQKQKLDLIDGLNARDLPAGTKDHEQVKLSEFETTLRAEESKLNVELGKLETEKSQRSLKQYEAEQTEIRNALEKNRSLQEYQKALADYDRTEQERVYRIAEMQSKISLVDEKLKEISTVRAQYASEVKRIRFIKQVNNQIDVELLLYISDRTDRRIRTNSQGSQTTGKTSEPFIKSSNTDQSSQAR